jgi:hypothetical protein
MQCQGLVMLIITIEPFFSHLNICDLAGLSQRHVRNVLEPDYNYSALESQRDIVAVYLESDSPLFAASLLSSAG